MTIEPDPDWYGSYARRSAIADFVELLALAHRSWSIEDLADRIRDCRWTRTLGERIGTPADPDDDDGDIADEIDEALERSSDVLAVVRERGAAIGAAYPFQLHDSGRLTYTGPEPSTSPYVRLLAITVGHATRIPFEIAVHQVFEGIVESALKASALLTTGVGARSRRGGGFSEVLSDCCEAVGLEAYPARAPARVFANDEGSDVLTNVWPHDRRSGGLQLVGQVTCARSNDWDEKIQEPSTLQWRDWLGRVPSRGVTRERAWTSACRVREVVRTRVLQA